MQSSIPVAACWTEVLFALCSSQEDRIDIFVFILRIILDVKL